MGEWAGRLLEREDRSAEHTRPHSMIQSYFALLSLSASLAMHHFVSSPHARHVRKSQSVAQLLRV